VIYLTDRDIATAYVPFIKKENGDENDFMQTQSGGCWLHPPGVAYGGPYVGIRESRDTHIIQPWLRVEMPQAAVHPDLRPYISKAPIAVAIAATKMSEFFVPTAAKSPTG
jgi:hypothetical protein